MHGCKIVQTGAKAKVASHAAARRVLLAAVASSSTRATCRGRTARSPSR